MTSKADTLKVAQADLTEIKNFLHEATISLQGRGLYARRPEVHIEQAIPRLEKVTHRLRQAFNVEEGSDA